MKWRIVSKAIDNYEKNVSYIKFEDNDKNFIQRNLDNIFSNNHKECVLCIGQVQSGKTANIIECIKYGINNKYPIIVVIGGITNLLLEQTRQRIEDNINDFNRVKILNTKEELINIERYLSQGYTVVSIVIKGKDILESLFCNLNSLDLENDYQNVLIIDDECDYGSLNINGGSTIHNNVVELYNRISNGKLLNFTGTPFANILSEISIGNRPDRIVVLENYNDYCGCEKFNNSNCYVPKEYVKSNLDINALMFSFKTWIITTAIYMLENEEKCKSEFLINVDTEKYKHEILKSNLFRVIRNFYDSIDHIPFWIDDFLKEMNLYQYVNYKNEIIDNVLKILKYLSDFLSITVLNSNNVESKKFKSGHYDFHIVIAGFMASRGFTFDNLMTVLFLNNPEDEVKIDTLLQKCRWFGNRKNRMHLMKIITNDKIVQALNDAQKYIELFEKGSVIEDINAIELNIMYLDERNKVLDRKVVSTDAKKRK